MAALAIGLATHLVWDGFTHQGRWGTDLVPVLRNSIGGTGLATWLHYASSVAGLAALAWYAVVALRRRRPEPVAVRAPLLVTVAFWAVVAMSVLLGAVVGVRILLS